MNLRLADFTRSPGSEDPSSTLLALRSWMLATASSMDSGDANLASQLEQQAFTEQTMSPPHLTGYGQIHSLLEKQGKQTPKCHVLSESGN